MNNVSVIYCWKEQWNPEEFKDWASIMTARTLEAVHEEMRTINETGNQIISPLFKVDLDKKTVEEVPWP